MYPRRGPSAAGRVDTPPGPWYCRQRQPGNGPVKVPSPRKRGVSPRLYRTLGQHMVPANAGVAPRKGLHERNAHHAPRESGAGPGWKSPPGRGTFYVQI